MNERKAWEQLQDEPDAAYARFLVYRNMGIARSLDAAYRLANPVSGKVPKGGKKRTARGTPDTRRVPGQWQSDSAKFHWTERVTAWDIETLSQVGKAVVVKYVNALDAAFSKIIVALAKDKMMPRSWTQVIETLTVLGNFIPQETVAAVRHDPADAVSHAASADQADGAS